MSDVKVLAIYLPQFYPFPENDQWWGKGFTEWTNVGKAKPLFKGHYQPKVPSELGYYDLRLPIIREQQAELARYAGIYGFCYWHYWFGNGKRLMWEVFDEVLKTGKPNFPFCLGWANHSWYAKNWNSEKTKGKDRILIEQKYLGEDDYRKHFEYVLQAFRDERYVKIDEKPVFMIYDSHALPDDFIPLWNKWAKEAGFSKGIYFIANIYYNEDENTYLNKGYTAVSKSRLRSYYKQNLIQNIWGHLRAWVNTKIFRRFENVPDYKKVIPYLIDPIDDAKENVIPTIVPNYDHSPRSGINGLIYNNCTPDLFKEHVKDAVNVVSQKKNKIILLKSWNEWGEGNYVEPDLRYGRGWLDAIKDNIK